MWVVTSRSGTYQHIDRQCVLGEQIGFGEVLGTSHPGNFGRGVKKCVSHLTGEHVGLVTVGDGQQHIGIFGPGPFQDVGVGPVTEHGAKIEMVLQCL